MDKTYIVEWHTLAEQVSTQVLDIWTTYKPDDTTMGSLLVTAAAYVADPSNENRQALRYDYATASEQLPTLEQFHVYPTPIQPWFAGMTILDLCWHLLDLRHSLESTRRLLAATVNVGEVAQVV